MRRSSSVLAGALLGVMGGVSSCAGELRGDPASYEALRSTSGKCDAVPVFTRHCASAACHSGSNPTGSLDLSAKGIESRLLGVNSKSNGCEARLLIDPSDVDKSFLLEKIENASPMCGVRMPLVGDISPQELACIRSWVTALVGDGGVGLPDGGRAPRPDAGTDASTPDSGAKP
jgi:hypothetical protein